MEHHKDQKQSEVMEQNDHQSRVDALMVTPREVKLGTLAESEPRVIHDRLGDHPHPLPFESLGELALSALVQDENEQVKVKVQAQEQVAQEQSHNYDHHSHHPQPERNESIVQSSDSPLFLTMIAAAATASGSTKRTSTTTTTTTTTLSSPSSSSSSSSLAPLSSTPVLSLPFTVLPNPRSSHLPTLPLVQSGSAAPEPPAPVSLPPVSVALTATHSSSSSSSSSSTSFQKPRPFSNSNSFYPPPPSVFSQSALLFLGHLPLRLVLVVPTFAFDCCSFQLNRAPILIPLKLRKTPETWFHSCPFGSVFNTDSVVVTATTTLSYPLRLASLSYFQTWSLQSLAVAYALPILCAFSPSLVLPLGIFHICSLIASGAILPAPASSDHAYLRRHQSRHHHHRIRSHLSRSPINVSTRKMDAASSSSSTTASSLMNTGKPRIQSAATDASAGSSQHHHTLQHLGHHLQQQQQQSQSDNDHNQSQGRSHNPGTRAGALPGHNLDLDSASHGHGQGGIGYTEADEDEDAYHDDEDGRQSDEDESEGEPQSTDIEFWLQRCSICFDSRLDFCLEYCRDQFCRDCFQRYVKEVVSNSWGLDVTKIKCPVCQDTIPISEWRKYVDQGTLAQYQQYNQPYRSFSRFCNECDTEVVISRINKNVIDMPLQNMLPFLENMLKDLWKLLTCGGYQLLEPSLLPPLPSPESLSTSTRMTLATRPLSNALPRNNGVALSILQKFADDCRLFCRTPPQIAYNSASVSAFTPSYFSNLAFRAVRPPPPPVLGLSDQGTLTSTALSSQHLGTGTGFHQGPPGSSSEQKNSGASARPNGILGIYKTLMVPLLELLDLGSETASEDNSGTNIAMEGVDGSETGCKRKHITHSGPTVWTRAERKRRIAVKRALVQFSKDLASLETRPDQWKELQFLHVRWLRWDWCHKCDHELCLQCGQPSHHESQDCFGYMRSLVGVKDSVQTSKHKRSRSEQEKTRPKVETTTKALGKKKDRGDLDANTLQWKLKNTNPCPNCCILIHRDDGCNKVDCMLCGYRFCWVCRESWGVNCGFFKCGRQVQDTNLEELADSRTKVLGPNDIPDEHVQGLEVAGGWSVQTSGGGALHGPGHDVSPEKPEIGVPNVFVIQAKRSRA